MSESEITVLLDQNVPREIGAWLRNQRPDWTVSHATDVGLEGAADPVVFQKAQVLNAIIITYDEDFGDIRTYPPGDHAGIVRLRVWPTTIEETESALGRLLASVPDFDLPGSLVILDRNRIRIRRRPADESA